MRRGGGARTARSSAPAAPARRKGGGRTAGRAWSRVEFGVEGCMAGLFRSGNGGWRRGSSKVRRRASRWQTGQSRGGRCGVAHSTPGRGAGFRVSSVGLRGCPAATSCGSFTGCATPPVAAVENPPRREHRGSRAKPCGWSEERGAMSDRLTRKEMKRDEVVEALARSASTLSATPELLILGVVAVLVLALAGSGVDWWCHVQEAGGQRRPRGGGGGRPGAWARALSRRPRAARASPTRTARRARTKELFTDPPGRLRSRRR